MRLQIGLVPVCVLSMSACSQAALPGSLVPALGCYSVLVDSVNNERLAQELPEMIHLEPRFQAHSPIRDRYLITPELDKSLAYRYGSWFVHADSSLSLVWSEPEAPISMYFRLNPSATGFEGRGGFTSDLGPPGDTTGLVLRRTPCDHSER